MGLLALGAKAPVFKLNNQEGIGTALVQFKSQWVLLYFYPKASTPGCTKQAQSLSAQALKWKKLGLTVLGVSADDEAKLKRFHLKEKLTFNLLSDPEKTVINAYGAWGPKQMMGKKYEGILRVSYLINPQGKIAHVFDKVQTASHAEQVLEIIASGGHELQ